jgi:hypothetical protein
MPARNVYLTRIAADHRKNGLVVIGLKGYDADGKQLGVSTVIAYDEFIEMVKQLEHAPQLTVANPDWYTDC